MFLFGNLHTPRCFALRFGEVVSVHLNDLKAISGVGVVGIVVGIVVVGVVIVYHKYSRID
jgi:hypothetical protein